MSPDPEGGEVGGGGDIITLLNTNVLNYCTHESMIIVKHLSLCVSNILV